MLNLKVNPIGVDIPIRDYQKWMYPKIKKLWNITDESQFESYGRVYRNFVDVGYVPEVFIESSGTTYKQVYFDETNHSLVTFFDTLSTINYNNGTSEAQSELIFLCNISKLKPLSIYRADEEIRNDIMQLLHSDNFQFQLTGIEKDYKNVFKNFDGWIKNDQIGFRDRHPLHCFKLKFSVIYNIFDNN